VGTQLTKFWRT
jgi:copper resistance protein C